MTGFNYPTPRPRNERLPYGCSESDSGCDPLECIGCSKDKLVRDEHGMPLYHDPRNNPTSDQYPADYRWHE